jgi:hypothetical protein
MKGGSRQAAEGTARVLPRCAPAKVCVRESWRQGPKVDGPWRLACSALRRKQATLAFSSRHARNSQRRHAPVRLEAGLAAEEGALPPCAARKASAAQSEVRSRHPCACALCANEAQRNTGGERTVVGSLGGAVAVDLQARGALEALGAVRVATPARDAPVHRHPAAQRNAAAADRAGRGPGRRAHASARAQRTAALPAGQPTAEDTRRALQPGSARRRRSGASAQRGTITARRTCAGQCRRRASPCRRA